MAEKKFSQLTAKGATIADTDLVAISESAGGGTYTTKSVTGANIKGLVTDANLTTTDITTNNVSTSKHGFVPKAPNDNTKFLDGTGAWSTPAGGGGGLTVGTTAVTSGTVGRIFFQGSGDVVQQDSTLFWDNTNKRLGVGATPSSSVRLDVRAQGALSTDIAFRVRNSADTSNILTASGIGTVWSNGAGFVQSNTAYGEEALDANTTGFWNTAFGYKALTADNTGVQNTAFGYQAGAAITSASQNTVFGSNALRSATTSGSNTAIGYDSLAITTSGENTAVGSSSMSSNTNGTRNVALGFGSMTSNSGGSDNVIAGWYAGGLLTSGSSNVFLGMQAGYFFGAGTNLTSASSTILIGQDTRPNANSESNQIVIGHNAKGIGSNSVTIGNDSITTTQLRGNVISGNQAALATTATDGFLYIPTCAGTPTGTPTAITGKVPMVADTTNNKLYIYVGGAWTAMN